MQPFSRKSSPIPPFLVYKIKVFGFFPLSFLLEWTGRNLYITDFIKSKEKCVDVLALFIFSARRLSVNSISLEAVGIASGARTGAGRASTFQPVR